MLDFSDPAPATAAAPIESKQPARLRVVELKDGRLDITGLSKSLVLSELFNALPHGSASWTKPHRTIDQAWERLRKYGFNVSEWDEHEMHVDLRGSVLDPARYDKHVGKEGAARAAIETALVLINTLPWDRKAHDVQLKWER